MGEELINLQLIHIEMIVHEGLILGREKSRESKKDIYESVSSVFF